MEQKIRVLVIAEAANPEWVSVPLVGWSMAAALRRVADVHIVTQSRNTPAFRRAGLVEGKDFTSIDTERLARPAYRFASALRGGEGKGWTTMTAIASLIYPYFEYLVWRRFGGAIRRGDYDIVHRLTPLSPTTPSLLAHRCFRSGIPFVLGPLNGGLPWPAQFADARLKEREWLSYVRSIYKILPGRNQSMFATKVILVGSRHTEKEIPRALLDRTIYMPENGIDPDRFVSEPPQGVGEGHIRLCFVGRLVPYKGPDIAIDASLHLLRGNRAHMDIVGDGPMMAELVAQVAEAGVEHAVTFHGWVSHQVLKGILGKGSFFVFPSVREFGGGAVLEAMAMGLVPIVVAYGGPGELVTKDRGIAVPIGSREEIVRDISTALARLAIDVNLTKELSYESRTWAMKYMTWSAKAQAMLEIYKWALNKISMKPQPYK